MLENKSVVKHPQIVNDILPARAISGLTQRSVILWFWKRHRHQSRVRTVIGNMDISASHWPSLNLSLLWHTEEQQHGKHQTTSLGGKEWERTYICSKPIYIVFEVSQYFVFVVNYFVSFWNYAIVASGVYISDRKPAAHSLCCCISCGW